MNKPWTKILAEGEELSRNLQAIFRTENWQDFMTK